VGWEAVKAAEG